MPNSLPILIVGGFGINWQTYQPLKQSLEIVSGRLVFIATIDLLDWMNVIASDDYSGLLNRLDRTIHDTLSGAGVSHLVLVCHSAGGILARMYLGDQPYGRQHLVFNGFQRVSTLVTLGTPHMASRRGREGGMNQIAFAQDNYPGAYWRFIHYVTIISKGVFGAQNGTLSERGAWQSYSMLTGTGDQWGDGIVPLTCGTLEGARHVLLHGLRHDPRPDRPWYGEDEKTVQSWWTEVEDAERETIWVR